MPTCNFHIYFTSYRFFVFYDFILFGVHIRESSSVSEWKWNWNTKENEFEILKWKLLTDMTSNVLCVRIQSNAGFSPINILLVLIYWFFMSICWKYERNEFHKLTCVLVHIYSMIFSFFCHTKHDLISVLKRFFFSLFGIQIYKFNILYFPHYSNVIDLWTNIYTSLLLHKNLEFTINSSNLSPFMLNIWIFHCSSSTSFDFTLNQRINFAVLKPATWFLITGHSYLCSKSINRIL
jgi:hypothetical protein